MKIFIPFFFILSFFSVNSYALDSTPEAALISCEGSVIDHNYDHCEIPSFFVGCGELNSGPNEIYYQAMKNGVAERSYFVNCSFTCSPPEILQGGFCVVPTTQDDCTDGNSYSLNGSGLGPDIGCHNGCNYVRTGGTDYITEGTYSAIYQKTNQQCTNELENFDPVDSDNCIPSSFNLCIDNAGLDDGFLNHNNNGISPDPQRPGCLVSLGNDVLCTYAPKNCMNKNGRVTCAVPDSVSNVCIENGGSKVCLNSVVIETSDITTLITNPDANTEVTTTTEITENNIINDPPVSSVVTIRTVLTDSSTGDVTTTTTSETTNNDYTYNTDGEAGTIGSVTEQKLTKDLTTAAYDNVLGNISNTSGGLSDVLDNKISDIEGIDYSDSFQTGLTGDFDAFPSGSCNSMSVPLPRGKTFTLSCADTAHIRSVLSYVVWVIVLIAVFNDIVTSGRRA